MTGRGQIAGGPGAALPYRGRSLAIVVSTAPERGDVDRALSIARAATDLGAEVGIFFMHLSVAGLSPRRDALLAASEDGVELIACASSADEWGLSADALGVDLGSQDDHAALVHRADRLVALT